jgi:hypothetical protein
MVEIDGDCGGGGLGGRGVRQSGKVEVLHIAPPERSRVRVGVRPSEPIYVQPDNDPTYNIQLIVCVLWSVS